MALWPDSAHSGSQQCHALLPLILSVPASAAGGQPMPALQTVLPVWMERCLEVPAGTKLSLVVTALGLLLESNSPQLEHVMVRGAQAASPLLGFSSG